MTIKEKQQALNSLKDDKYFEVDKSLFISLFPRSPLNRELLRVNNYNKSRLHSNILYQLLSKCSKEDILKARMGQEPTEQSSQEPTADLIEELQEELKVPKSKKKGKKKSTPK